MEGGDGEEQQQQYDVLLYGLGAIGCFYAFILNRSKRVRLTVCARSNYEVVKEKGFVINSDNHGRHVVKPWKVVRTPAEADVKFDYIVCTHKAINQDAVPEQLKPVVNEETTIVILQNGVGNEDPFRNAFPENTILSGVIWVGAAQTEPGIVHHTKAEGTQIGLFPRNTGDETLEQSRLTKFCSLLEEGKTNFEIVSNIQIQRWEKVTWNIAWNALTTLTGLDVQAWLSSSADADLLSRRLMKEVIDVAQKCNVPLEYELVDRLIEKALSLAPITTSMQLDCKYGRPMEVDAILGTPVKKGRELGVAIPTLETLYVTLQAINSRLLRDKS